MAFLAHVIHFSKTGSVIGISKSNPSLVALYSLLKIRRVSKHLHWAETFSSVCENLSRGKSSQCDNNNKRRQKLKATSQKIHTKNFRKGHANIAILLLLLFFCQAVGNSWGNLFIGKSKFCYTNTILLYIMKNIKKTKLPSLASFYF